PPPPPAAATEVMSHPPRFAPSDRVWHRKPSVRIAGAGALLFVGALVSAQAEPPPVAAAAKPDASAVGAVVAAKADAPDDQDRDKTNETEKTDKTEKT